MYTLKVNARFLLIEIKFFKLDTSISGSLNCLRLSAIACVKYSFSRSHRMLGKNFSLDFWLNNLRT